MQPARLAFGLRERLLARGVRDLRGLARARAALDAAAAWSPRRPAAACAPAPRCVAVNAGERRRCAPLRDRLTVSSSHIVLTEPVPDVIEAIGWTGGEAITDGRALLHYFRTTRDGRILFGWGGGRMAAGARPGGRDGGRPRGGRARRARDLVRFFPALEGRRIEHAWGGPIDVSPTHLPIVTTLPGGRAHAAFGYTGNGVGPSHLAGRALAALALGRDRADRGAADRRPAAARAARAAAGRSARAAIRRGARRARRRRRRTGGGRSRSCGRSPRSPRGSGMHIVR